MLRAELLMAMPAEPVVESPLPLLRGCSVSEGTVAMMTEAVTFRSLVFAELKNVVVFKTTTSWHPYKVL